MALEVHTWSTYYKDRELKDIEWDKLKKYVCFIINLYHRFPAEDKIEESPPSIDDHSFNPGGWIGTYKVGGQLIRVIPNPDVLPIDEFEHIRRELIGWAEHVGPFLEEFLGKYSGENISKRLFFMSYSRYLIEYTETLLAHFISRDVSIREYVGRELRGPPLWKKTIVLKAKGSEFLASKRTEFSLRTLINMLLTRFHAELLSDMNAFLSKVTIEEIQDLSEWKAYRSYHMRFITSDPWVDFITESLDIDFRSGEVLEKIRSLSKGEAAEIVDLWEAYITDRSFFTEYGKRFDTALKPLSKVYELWCLKKLCEILKIDPKQIKSLPCKIPFNLLGEESILYYNVSKELRKHSGIMVEIGVEPGRPDFAIESNGKITCIMDAKCKIRLSTEDVQRLLSYILDYMYPSAEKLPSIIFYPSREEGIRKVKARECEIYLIPMTPTTHQKVKEEIKSIIETSIKTNL
ncbi:MAG: hypothetical protein QXL27_09080 [Candidatus Bathyarchaeia archaeon]